MVRWHREWNGKSFDTARSNEAAEENDLATFAYRIILNMNELRGHELKRDHRSASIRLRSFTNEKPA